MFCCATIVDVCVRRTLPRAHLVVGGCRQPLVHLLSAVLAVSTANGFHFCSPHSYSFLELSHLVSLTEMCHLRWLPSRGNGAVAQILATHVSFLQSVNGTQLWNTYQCSLWTNYVTTIHLHGSKVLICHRQRDCGWQWSGFGRVVVCSRLCQQPEVQRSITGTFVRYTSRRNGAVAIIITRNTPQV